MSIVAGLLLAVGLIEGFSQLAYGTWQPWDRADTVSVPDLVKLALAIVAGVGAAQALVVGYRRQRDSERDPTGALAVEASSRDQLRLWTERFGAAATQLGGGHPAVRLAGVYAMAALADEWEAQQQQCIDVLCAYLRLPYQHRYVQGSARPTNDVPELVVGEREVRLTVIRVIRDHVQRLPPDEGGERLDWRDRDFDFGGAVFDGGDFTDSEFAGTVNFDGAKFVSGMVLFDHMEVRGVLNFMGAEFKGADVSFGRIRALAGHLDFERAQFESGMVAFNGSIFPKGGANVVFINARFVGADVIFDGVEFSENVWFDGAVFTGGKVTRNGKDFRGP